MLRFRAIEVPALGVVSAVSLAPDLPCFLRGGFDELGRTRFDRVRRLIDALLKILELDTGAFGEIAVATGDGITK